MTTSPNNEVMQNVAYYKKEGCFEVYDEYGGTTISIPEMKELIKLVKKHHPELLK